MCGCRKAKTDQTTSAQTVTSQPPISPETAGHPQSDANRALATAGNTR